MTVFLCSKCGAAITPELAELPAVPDAPVDDRDRDKETRRAPSTVPRGHYAIDISPGIRHTVVVHPDDAAGLGPLPDWKNSNGCCGPAGNEGLNLACPCGAPVATLAADCFGPYELHLDPVRTYAFTG